MPRLKELDAARSRLAAQSKELARLNGIIAAHKTEQHGRKKRKVAPQADTVQAAAVHAVGEPESSDLGWAQVESTAVVELERHVVTLRAEKALAVDQAQRKISALEQAIVGAGLAGPFDVPQDEPEAHTPSSSSALHAEAMAILASCERRFDSVATGLVQLSAEIVSLA
ncbi:hypothetical protein JCM3775_001213 [Rhodotorula graminis]